MNWDRFAGEAIYLDTNIVIFAIESREPWFNVLQPLFEAFDRGSIRAITSELTVAEALAQPIAAGNHDLIFQVSRVICIRQQPGNRCCQSGDTHVGCGNSRQAQAKTGRFDSYRDRADRRL